MPGTDHRIEGRIVVASVIPDDVGIISKEARQAIEDMGPGECSLIIDFSGVNRLPGSTSLQTLTLLWRKLKKRGGEVVLCSLSPNMLSLFTMTQMDRLFHMASDVEDALAYIAGQDERAGHAHETEELRTNSISGKNESVFQNRLKGIGRLDEPEKLSPTPPPAEQLTPAVALRLLAAGWPDDVERRAAALAAAHLAYREAYAEQLEPVVNARIRQAIEGGTSYDQKKEVVKSLNEYLRQGGLAIRCEAQDASGDPSTYPGIFVIGTARHEGGRFRVEYQDAKGNKKAFGVSPSSPVKLMVAPSRQDRQLSGPDTSAFAERLTSERTDRTGNDR